MLVVAPYVGAWIETYCVLLVHCPNPSLPTWERGLKPGLITRLASMSNVAPYVGAWIETTFNSFCSQKLFVAPYVGAWIETTDGLYYEAYTIVAPYVGAWIETSQAVYRVAIHMSLPTWERGLKPPSMKW